MITNFKLFEKKTEQQEISELAEFIKKVKLARKEATDAHKGQFRKKTTPEGDKLEYITHPEEVAKIVHKVKKSHKIAHIIAAAYLHDVIEDGDKTLEEIKEKFGEIVYSLVKELTSDKDVIKEMGKEKYLITKMLNMSSWALVIKLADRLQNLKDLPTAIESDNEKDIAWAIKYGKQTQNIIKELEEKRELSNAQKMLVSKIKTQLKPIFNYIEKNKETK